MPIVRDSKPLKLEIVLEEGDEIIFKTKGKNYFVKADSDYGYSMADNEIKISCYRNDEEGEY
jgi:hypothetical protein